MPTYVVFLGPPGSGKGTQAKLLSTEYGLPQISTGDLFRAMKTETTPLARRVQDIMAAGGLVPDDVTIELVKDRLGKDDCSSGAVLDGFPRTVPQAEALDVLLTKDFNSRVVLVPLFEVSKEETIRRIMGRSGQEGRADDSPEVAETRYKVYIENTAPLIEYYRHKGVLVSINGEQSIDRVTDDLKQVIDKYLTIR